MASVSIQPMCGQLHMLDALMHGDREGFFSGWELLRQSARIMSLLGLYCVM